MRQESGSSVSTTRLGSRRTGGPSTLYWPTTSPLRVQTMTITSALNRACSQFRINLRDSSVDRGVINVSRIQSRPDTLTFIWESYQFGKITASTRDILVRGGPRRCKLIPEHTSFRSINELDWYSNVWNLSLSKLHRLMESLRAFPETTSTRSGPRENSP
jgi:hypothetical protein